MSIDPATISRLDLTYKNLVLTGFLGVGKSTIGLHLVKRLGVEFLDIDDEIELREQMSIAKLRELYGDSRLRSLEHDLCRQQR
jgi:shikimate kinase